jgi:hypothetical protein
MNQPNSECAQVRSIDRAARRRNYLILLLVTGGIINFWCSNSHFCMHGHLAHGIGMTDVAIDLVWIISFVSAAVFSLRTDLLSAITLTPSLSYLVASRLDLIPVFSAGFHPSELESTIAFFLIAMTLLMVISQRARYSSRPKQ